MRKVEILAPAGSYESLCGAINGGCDAVYLGGNKFGARAFAENFDEETMLRSIDYVHLFDKSLYLTVNTLLHNEEIEESLYSYLEKYYEQGLDAVIVQDVGVLQFIHRNFPKLPIHASTQMTFTTEKGGELLKEHGVTRFVTSRELNAKEIASMRKHTDLEIETFVHGALCYSYSGQCLLSSMIGGRSGNRGRCAQPCRMPYKVYDASGKKISALPYVLSPKDICTLDSIPDLVDAGIDSFKIEGRMKKPEYAAFTAHLYRKYTDLYLEYGEQYSSYIQKHQKELAYDYTCLMDLYNRGGFSKGYFYQKNGPKGMSMLRPNHSGVLVGTVERMKKNRAGIRLQEDVYAQDVLEFRREDGTVLYEYTVKDDVAKKQGYTETNTKPGSNIFSGVKVYRTRRNQLLDSIKENILENPCKLEVEFVCSVKEEEPISLVCSVGDCSVEVFGPIAEGAKSQPVTKERLQKQLRKTNNTSFVVKSCEIEMEEKFFIPMGQINELRRNALEVLEKAIVEKYRRTNDKPVSLEETTEVEKQQTGLVASVRKIEQAYAAAKEEFVSAVYCDLGTIAEQDILQFAKKTEKKIMLIFPAIIREEDYAHFSSVLSDVYKEKKMESSLGELFALEQVEGFILKNYESVQLYKEYIKPYTEKVARLDYNMYTFNREAKNFWKQFGIEKSTASVEFNGAEYRRNGCQGQDLLVYGYPALMTSAQCVCKNVKECKKIPEILTLVDRYEKEFSSLNCCKYCYNQLYDKLPISLHEYMEEIMEFSPEHLRLDFLQEDGTQVGEIIEFYASRMVREDEMECPIIAYTTGHFRKGVK